MSGWVEASFFGIEGLARFEDPVDLMDEFAHNGYDDFFGFLAVFFESFGEFFEKRVVCFGGHGGKVESTTQRGGSNFGNGGSGAAGGAAFEVTRCEPDPGRKLTSVTRP